MEDACCLPLYLRMNKSELSLFVLRLIHKLVYRVLYDFLAVAGVCPLIDRSGVGFYLPKILILIHKFVNAEKPSLFRY